MTVEIRIPSLGAGMSEGRLVSWHVADGGGVQEGELLYTLESEKTVQEIASPAEGVLSIIAAADEIYPVGELLGTIS